MKIKVLYILLLLNLSYLYGQNETSNWLFGNKAGISFKDSQINLLSDESQIIAPAGCSSISDIDGNLLFYTNGETIWNKNHLIMENGTQLAGDILNTQNALIIPKPNSNNIFYLFSTREKIGSNPFFSSGVYYSEIEISDTFPLGKVIKKNFKLSNLPSAEKLTAVHHADGNSIWLIALTSSLLPINSPKNLFHILKITEDGLQNSKLKKVSQNISSAGAMKISPDGTKFAVADYNDRYIYIYDFNTNTGEISNPKTINTDEGFGVESYPYGIEFSPNSKILYYSTSSNIGTYTLTQYQFENTDPFTKKVKIHTSRDFVKGSLQLAINGKIYVALQAYQNGDTVANNSIGVINFPNKIGADCNYQDNSLNIVPGSSEKGLPNFIQSYFRNRIVAKDDCVSSFFDFTLDSYKPIDSVIWDFGDGTTSTDFNPKHKYSVFGKYIVNAKITIENKTINLFKNLNVYKLPELKQNEKLIQCDTDNNGVDYFDLYDITDKITNQNIKLLDFIFYKSLNDAEDSVNAIDNPNSFENQSNPQKIFVKVTNEKGCYSIEKFTIESIFVNIDEIENMYACENSDNINGNNEGVFDLELKNDQIRAYFNFPTTTKTSFYPSLIEAQTTSNILKGELTTASTTIWLRVETILGCGGIEPVKLIVNPAPIININDNYTICSNPTIHTPVVLNGNSNNDRFEWKNSTDDLLSTNKEFTLTKTGLFSLTVYKFENGIECSNSKIFSVDNPKGPIFTDINVSSEAENNTVFVSINGNSSYEFSLNNEDYFSGNLSYTFQSVNPGIHTVYVRDLYQCEPSIQKTFSVLGFPKFFTPNNDGYNDTWSILGVNKNFYSNSKIYIFDRYGKLVTTIKPEGFGWDGTFNGKQLQSSDYWFKAELTDKTENTQIHYGHFSLIRK